ncbi:MAG: hypothetical protein EZS28_016736 [Streblomastix strix]|uniref:Uncharacterized protein n=1 Tax=Streblomastix strix TaxID=222440 RepID=A0A5J4VYM9_9EUKA|nr:MAG: hypothetical protein EZS28_016736 [Streblomastix strix]
MAQSDSHSDIIDYSDVLQTLRIPLTGSQAEKKSIFDQQENVCLKIITKLQDKIDDEGRQRAIKARITNELIKIYESRDLSEISLPFIEAFYCISFPGDKVDFRPKIYRKRDPFPGLIRLLELQNIEMLRATIKTIGSMINGGIEDKNSEHPYFESIISINGGNKIFSLFQRADVDNEIRNISAICIGRLFKSQGLPETMKQPIIDHLKSIVLDQDEWARSQSVLSIGYLAQDEDNYTEIMKGFDLFAIISDLRLPIIGNEEQRKLIQLKKNLDCVLLQIMVDKETYDNSILLNLIEAGITETLLNFFQTQDLNMISCASVKIFGKIQSLAKNLINQLKQQKKYYSSIIRMFGSSFSDVISEAYSLIGHDIAVGADQAKNSSPNPIFQEISQCGGLEILFNLFQRNLNQKSKDYASNLLVMLFVKQEFPNALMRKEIILHYVNILINAYSKGQKIDIWCLKALATIAGNHSEILKDDFITKAVSVMYDNYDEKGGLVLIGIKIVKDIIKNWKDIVQQKLEDLIFIDQILKPFKAFVQQQIKHEIVDSLIQLVNISSNAQNLISNEMNIREIIIALDSKDENAILDALQVLSYILLSINQLLLIKQENQIHEMFERSGGLIKLIQIFQNNSYQNKLIDQYSIISIGLLHKAVKVPDEIRSAVIDKIKQMNELGNDEVSVRLSVSILSMLAENEQNHADITSGGFKTSIARILQHHDQKIQYQGLTLVLNLMYFGSEEMKQKVKQDVHLFPVHQLTRSRDQNAAMTAKLLKEWLLFFS